MNDGYYIGLIPGLIGDLIGDSSEEILNGYDGDPDYQYEEEEQTRPIKGGDGNPNALKQPQDIIEVEEDGIIYVFDRNGDYVTEYPSSEKDYHKIYMDEYGEIVHDQINQTQSSTSTMTPAVDANGNTVYIDGNGNIIYPESEDEDDGEYFVPTSAPMTDYAGNTFYVDSNGKYVDSDGDPYEPVLAPTVSVFYDELGNLWDSDGNLVEPAPNNGTQSSNNAGTSSGELTDELGNPIIDYNGSQTSNNGNSNTNNNSTNTGDVTLRDETGEPIINIIGDNVINEPPELDSEDEENYIPTNKPTVKYDKPTNYNSTIGSRASYWAP